MSKFHTEITLENPRDVEMARRGYMRSADVRRVTLEAKVNTGAFPLVISEEVRARLGLKVLYTDMSKIAEGEMEIGSIIETVTVYWKNRHISCTAFMPFDETEVLLGAFPLDGMGLMVSPNCDEVIIREGNHLRFTE